MLFFFQINFVYQIKIIIFVEINLSKNKAMKTLLKFYLKNFKFIHHLFFIVLVFSTLKLLSFAPFLGWIFDVIFQPGLLGLIFKIGILAYCFKVNPIILEKAGLTDDYMKEELENLDKKK